MILKSPTGDSADVWLLGVDCGKGLLGKFFEPSGLPDSLPLRFHAARLLELLCSGLGPLLRGKIWERHGLLWYMFPPTCAKFILAPTLAQVGMIRDTAIIHGILCLDVLAPFRPSRNFVAFG